MPRTDCLHFLLLIAYTDPTLTSITKNYTILACQNLFLDLSPKMSFQLQFFFSDLHCGLFYKRTLWLLFLAEIQRFNLFM